MVKILADVLTEELPAVEAAYLQVLSECVHSADVILNMLARQRDRGQATTILTPEALRLRQAPPLTAPVMINSGAPVYGTNEESRPRNAGHDDQAQARAAAFRRRSLESRDLGEAGGLDQVRTHCRQATAGPRTSRTSFFKDTPIDEAFVSDLAGSTFIAHRPSEEVVPDYEVDNLIESARQALRRYNIDPSEGGVEDRPHDRY
jgi:hypothetical protein